MFSNTHVLIRRGLTDAARAELGAMPVTESEALQLSGGPWQDAVVRNRKKIEWQIWAQRKYQSLGERAEAMSVGP